MIIIFVGASAVEGNIQIAMRTFVFVARAYLTDTFIIIQFGVDLSHELHLFCTININ
jgi:hypothetical protein